MWCHYYLIGAIIRQIQLTAQLNEGAVQSLSLSRVQSGVRTSLVLNRSHTNTHYIIDIFLSVLDMRNGLVDVTFLCSLDSFENLLTVGCSLDALHPRAAEKDLPKVYGRALAQGIKDGVPARGV